MALPGWSDEPGACHPGVQRDRRVPVRRHGVFLERPPARLVRARSDSRNSLIIIVRTAGGESGGGVVQHPDQC
jgi:hypothetical protein